MTNTIQELFDRKSVRVFTDREISAEDRALILRSAAEAPTAGNMQMYTIIDVQDQKEKEELSVLCDNQPFIAGGKLVLIFAADYQRWYDAFEMNGAKPRKPGKGDLLLSIVDATIAAQNTVTAAHSLGIGSCYIGDILENCEKVRALLNLPDFVVPSCMLVFGYPTQQQKDREKPARFPMDDIVCVDKYEKKDVEALRSMFSGKCGKQSFEDWARAFCDRKYNSDFSVEMQRSAAEYLKKYTD